MYSSKLKMVVLFSYGKVKDKDFLIRIKFYLGRATGRGKREGIGRIPK